MTHLEWLLNFSGHFICESMQETLLLCSERQAQLISIKLRQGKADVFVLLNKLLFKYCKSYNYMYCTRVAIVNT